MTTPPAPTAEALARALALIDSLSDNLVVRRRGDGAMETVKAFGAVVAVARAVVDHQYLDCDATAAALNAAVAALAALAAPAEAVAS